MDETAKLVAILVLASFAIERLTAALSYAFDSIRLYRVSRSEGARLRAKQKRKLAVLVAGGALAFGVVMAADLRILRTLDLIQAPTELDVWLTWLVLFAGTDRIREFLKDAGSKGRAAAATDRPGVPAFRIHVEEGADFREITRVG